MTPPTPMNPFDLDPPVPLTEAEAKALRARAEAGEIPTLAIVRRFIATIRKSILASPAKIEKTKTTRNKKPVVDEDQVKFF